MKKIIIGLLLAFSIFAMAGVCSASVSRDKDDFTGAINVHSAYDNGGYYYYFYKSLTPTQYQYTIRVVKPFYGTPTLTIPTFAQNSYMKIGEDIYTLILLHTEMDQRLKDLGFLNGTYEVPIEIVDKLKNTDLPIIWRTKWNYPGQSEFIENFKVPQNLTQEWKNVFITES